MRYGKWCIGLFTAALLLAALVFGANEYGWDGSIGITAEISTAFGTEEVGCWERYHKDYLLFLPSHGDEGTVRLKANTPAEVFLEGIPLEDVLPWELPQDTPLKLEYRWRGRTYDYQLTLLQSRNIPAMYLDTASGSMDTIHEERGKSEPGDLRLYTETGVLDYSGRLESIKGRGNSTWEWEKKPYNLTLSEKGDLLGMGDARKWILLANAMDSSHLRNKVVYDFSRDFGLPWSPECRWVELYLNGSYAGLYLLCERNEVDAQRVDISRENSFLVVKDWPWRFRNDGDPYFQTAANTALGIRYSGMPLTELEAIWQRAENAILAEDGADPASGQHWQELLDVDSWVKKILVEEGFANPDGAALSQFFYYDGAAEGRICAGPVWDYDLIMGGGPVNILYTQQVSAYGSAWYEALYRQETFYARMIQLYEAEFLPLVRQYQERKIPAYREQIRQAAFLDQRRWGTKSMEEESTLWLSYLRQRMEFLSELWLSGKKAIYIDAGAADDSARRYVLYPGQVLKDLPAYEDTPSRTYYWVDRNTGQPFDVTQPVYEDVYIELRYRELESPQTPAAPAEEPEQETLSLGFYAWPAVLLLLLCGVVFADAGRVWQEKGKKKAGISPKKQVG